MKVHRRVPGTPGIGRFAVLAAIVLGSVCQARAQTAAEPSDNSAARSLDRAARYLWSQQGADGGWHSRTYGLLASGQALTPFVLHALVDVPEHISPRPPGALERALEFIRRHANHDGVLGLADPDLAEYPNYATAYGLRCLLRAGHARDAELVGRMRSYLASEQFSTANGFSTESPAFGGWGFGGPRRKGETGHMDLAHTRRVLEALREAELPERAPFERAELFLRYVQRHPSDQRPQPIAIEETSDGFQPSYDGGFYFSPVVLAANKGRIEPAAGGAAAYYRSYATATCDGVLALLAAGVPVTDERVQAARAWLERHPLVARAQGIPLDQPDAWSDALYFYHLAVRAEAYRALGWPGDWRRQLCEEVASQQRPDGSFVNSRSHLMKEDDPLLATALATVALAHALADQRP